jgi:hypothetical protein
VSPYIFDGAVTGESYLEVLREVVVRQHWNHLTARWRSTVLQFTSSRIT